MIRTGDTIDNPVTGERLVFHRTSADTGGEFVLLETIVQPRGFVAAAHVHPFQSERFEVISGSLGLRVGRERLVAGPGEIITVHPGTAHRFWNAGRGDVRFMCEVRPALQFERLLETMFALARAGKTNRKGMPNKLRLAVIARAHFDVVRLPFPPVPLQRAGLAVGAALGRIAGYQASFVPGPPSPSVGPLILGEPGSAA